MDHQEKRAELSIVIPAFNEAARLPPMLENLVERFASPTIELIVVDDGSTDDTFAIAERSLSTVPRARVLRHDCNIGKGAALVSGVDAARGRNIVTMDADEASDLDDLHRLLDGLAATPIVIGSRVTPGARVLGESTTRRLASRTFRRFVEVATPLDVSDTQCGFKAFRGRAAKLLFALQRIDGFAHDVDLLLLAHAMGVEVSEIPVRWTAVEGSKVQPLRHSLQMAGDVLRHRNHVLADTSVAAISIDKADRHRCVAAIRVTDLVLDAEAETLVVLPGQTEAGVHGLRRRLLGRGIETTVTTLAVAELLHPGGRLQPALRSALGSQ